MPAFRKHKFVDKCASCSGFATTRCKRCVTPFCDEHKPRRRKRCAACERDFALANPAADGGGDDDDDDGDPVTSRLGTAGSFVTMTAVPTGVVLMALGITAGVIVAGVGLLVGGIGTAAGMASHGLSRAAESAGGVARAKLRKRARKRFLRERKPRALLPAGED